MPDLTRRVSAFRKSDWLRAGVLCILVLLTSTARPSVLVAVPFLLLVGTNALRGYALLIGIADIYLDFRKRSEQLAAR